MKITLRNELLPLNILAVLLILIITFFPSHVLRIVLGLPFILFFPGYTLIAALFPRKSDLGGIERVALSFGLSIAVVPLMGLILNYTPWGIRLYPILISLAIFILATSIVAWYRRRRLSEGERLAISFNLTMFPWKGQSLLDRTLSVVLIIAILGAIGTLGYVIATPKVGEKFTEFYLLGSEGKAENYPTELAIGEKGKVILGIVNHEHEEETYRVEVRIDGEKVKVWLDGAELDEVGPIVLAHEEKREHEVGFSPRHTGQKQKVEFVLYMNDQPYFKDPPHLWIDVKER
jgi:uncharacterized membrane protein